MQELDAELRPAWRNYWFSFLIIAVLLIIGLATAGGESKQVGPIFLGLAMLIFLYVAYKKFSWKFTLDSKRVSRHNGLISRNQQSVRIKDLRSVEMDQSIFQRMFGIGDLLFYSAGSDRAEVIFYGIKQPKEWRDNIEHALDQLKDSNND